MTELPAFFVHARTWILLGIGAVVSLACTVRVEGDEQRGESDSGSDEGPIDGDDTAGFAATFDEGGDTDLGPVDSHDEDIQPIWTQRCVVYCHSVGANGPAGELDLEAGLAYEALVGQPSIQADMLLVSPGSLDESYLWHKLVDSHLEVGGSGVQMPKDGVPLDEETLARIETWLLIGAPP